jgi:ribonuclease D
VCLIQISIPEENYLVDPLALEDLSPLAPFFASHDIEKVFHAADYDLIVLQRDFGFTCGRLFDTMWAARILGWPHVGLADILEKYFDVHVNKRFQRYNWGRRPLDPKALTYAWMDSYYLLDLRDIQHAELQAKGRWQEAQEVFTYLRQTVEVPEPLPPSASFWRIKGLRNLRSTQDKRVLYQLHLWRERKAEELDRPTVKVVTNRQLVKLARIQPRTRDQLYASGLSSFQVQYYGDEILKALKGEPPSLPRRRERQPRPPESVLSRYHSLKAWRKDVAMQRGVDPDVILPNAVLWEIAREVPDSLGSLREIVGIGPWRQRTYGPDILELVA